MKKELFNELLESVREAKAIMRGEKPPSRVFVYDEPVEFEIVDEEVEFWETHSTADYWKKHWIRLSRS